jgi:hypothetical protein
MGIFLQLLIKSFKISPQTNEDVCFVGQHFGLVQWRLLGQARAKKLQ